MNMTLPKVLQNSKITNNYLVHE